MIIPKRTEGSHSKYEAGSIYLKEECRDGCGYYWKLGLTEYCGGGKHFQFLFEGERLIRCPTRTLIKKGEIQVHSIEYIESIIDYLIERNKYYNEKCARRNRK